MRKYILATAIALASMAAVIPTEVVDAHKLRSKGEPVAVADSGMMVTPSRDWNRLNQSPGKRAETWTLDGEQLNDVTFFGGIEPGNPLVRERHKKKDPLPKFTANTLLVEVPELLEGTYRTYKDIGTFQMQSVSPAQFLGQAGIKFMYEYTDQDNLTRKGEARAVIIQNKLYMITFDAPRLYYFDRAIGDFQTMADTARL